MLPGDDVLTGLRNRTAFMPLLKRQAWIASDKRIAMGLVVIDIDGFARINGAHGFDAGDTVLVHLATQLNAVIRKQDYAARIGDNRFALLLTNVMNVGHVELAIHKLLRLLEVPVQLREARLTIPVSIGAALCPQHASQPDHLLRRAEAALMGARRDGMRHAVAADATADHVMSDLWDLELQIGDAVERGELTMHYQPKARAGDLAFLGAEALMRWNSSARGIISPDVFIPMAERTGHIKRLTVWALNSALRHASQWPPAAQPLTVSVNLPGMLATQEDLPDLVADALKLWSAPHVRLMLEITEGSLMDTAHAFDILARVRALGVGISIDDFGTGYSCLAYFKSIPADELKIDRSFVTGMVEDDDSRAIVQLVVDLAHRFKLGVAAEGVEDLATLEALRAMGCDIIQGFLYGKPMAQVDLLAWLASRAPVLVPVPVRPLGAFAQGDTVDMS